MSAGALLPLLGAIEIESPTAFRLGGERLERAAATPADAAAAADGRVLVPLLTEALYARAYVRPLGAPPPPLAAPSAPDDLTPGLSAANPGREGWESGWRVVQALASGRLVAERHGRTRFLAPGEFLATEAPGVPPRAGAQVTLWRPRESATLQPGFYFAFGRAPWEDEVPVLRLYWNVRPEGAAALLRTLAGTLDRWEVPFRFKCLARRSLYPRADAAVLYVPRRAWPLLADLLPEAHRAVAEVLDAETPLFALQIGRGTAAAEDPGTGESFGMHRCRLVAEGAWRAWRDGARAPEARLEAMAEAFGRAGVSLERPWLAPGSAREYAIVLDG